MTHLNELSVDVKTKQKSYHSKTDRAIVSSYHKPIYQKTLCSAVSYCCLHTAVYSEQNQLHFVDGKPGSKSLVSSHFNPVSKPSIASLTFGQAQFYRITCVNVVNFIMI